jgi:hypothetical protein
MSRRYHQEVAGKLVRGCQLHLEQHGPWKYECHDHHNNASEANHDLDPRRDDGDQHRAGHKDLNRGGGHLVAVARHWYD